MLASRRYLQFFAICGRLLPLLLVTSAYGCTTTSSAPTPQPEGAASAPSGYYITNINYTLGATNPGDISRVRFTVTPAAGAPPATTVNVKLVSSSTIFFACDNAPAGSTTWECPITGVTVAAADLLTVRTTDPHSDRPYVLRLPLIRALPRQHLFLPVVSH